MNTISDPLYYLRNFRIALAWLSERYADLLSESEAAFIADFNCLPELSQALLVRLIMRRGDCFRATKIVYPEIGSIEAAMAPLIERRWVDPAPELTASELSRLLTRQELLPIAAQARRSISKAQLIAELELQSPERRTLQAWRGEPNECAYRILAALVCTRLRLLFFGSFHQDWSEFVITELGLFKYEVVDLSLGARPFESREDIESFYQLHDAREILVSDAATLDALAAIPSGPIENEWLARRRDKLLFRVGHQLEREGNLSAAEDTYQRCAYPESRVRLVRVLELQSKYSEALRAAEESLSSVAEPEQLRIRRMLSRLRSHVGGIRERRPRCSPPATNITLPNEAASERVEERVRRHLERAHAPVFYVENALINSLFGLLCWDAIFAPVRGAFFHPFHSGPADLLSPEFARRRKAEFACCFERLTNGTYLDAIRRTRATKHGIRSPFVAWQLLTDELLSLALACIPAQHLERCFEHIVEDIRANSTGLPDLIQFFPLERRYVMIEVKGPGDRLQDNQRRWIAHCHRSGIPITVAHATWPEAIA